MNHDKVTAIQDAISNRNGIDVDDLTAEDLHDAECMYFVAPLPSDFKKRVQFLGDLLAQMTMNNNIDIKDDRLRLMLRTVSTTFSYLLNSSSFQDGVLHSYDASEVAKRLRPWRDDNER